MAEEKKPSIIDIDIKLLKPYIPLLQQYFGLPFPELELEWEAAQMETNPDADHSFRMNEYVSSKTVEDLLHSNFDRIKNEDQIKSLLWLAANLYYSGNLESHEAYDTESVLDQIEQSTIREEIAQLYSYVQKRKQTQTVGVGEYAFPGKPIELVSDDKTVLRIDNTDCWFEAMLENHLFPNCLPDVENDEDAQMFLEKNSNAPGPKTKRVNNAIIHGVEMFLHDQEVVDSKPAAPQNLCMFIRDYLTAMGLLDDMNEKDRAYFWINIQKRIPEFRKKDEKTKLFNVELKSVSIEELSCVTPDQAAYQWLFYPNRIKEEEEKKEEEKLEDEQKPNEKKSIGNRIDLLLSHTRDIIRKGVYKKGKKENTSQS